MSPVHFFHLIHRRYCIRFLGFTVCLIAAAFPLTAGAQTPEITEELDPVVVTARETATPLSRTPGGVGVITRGEIDQIRPVSLTDITRSIPGVEKTSDSPWGSDINIRGLSRNSVLFLIDGCRVNTATDINARFGLINPSDIQGIEVLKGPISALYGWGAMGGVVNVITRKGQYSDAPQIRGEFRADLRSNPGGYGTYGLGVYESTDTWLLASGGYRDHDEQRSAGKTILHNSQYRDVYGRFGGGHKWNGMNETEVNIQVMEGQNIGIPGKGLALPEGPDATYPSTRRILGAVTHTLTPGTGVMDQSRVRIFFQEVERNVRMDNFPPANAAQAVEPGADHTTLGLNWTSRLSLGDHGLVAGMEVWQWKIDDTERTKYLKNGLVGIDSSLGEVSQTVGGIFAEDTWDLFQDLNLNLGGRMDATRVKSDDLDNWISPPSSAIAVTQVREGETEEDTSFQGHVGLTWQVAPQWSATSIVAVSYRPPDLMDRFKYVSLGSGVSLYGNPDLDPERSLFFETGIHYVTDQIRVSGNAFYNRLRDMITETRKTASRIEMENVDQARIYGSELSMAWQMNRAWKSRASLAWTRGDNQTKDEGLPYIAPLNSRFSLRWEPSGPDGEEGGWVEAVHEWASAQNRVPAGQESSESWQTVDLYAGYRFRSLGLAHALTFGVTNLFDEDYSNFLATSRGLEVKEAGIGLVCSYRIQF